MPVTGLDLIVVTGKYLKLDGTAAAGTVSFVPTEILFNPVAKEVVYPSPFLVTLDAFGAFSTSLPATTDPDINPTGWVYTVTENITGFVTKRIFLMQLPYNGGPVDMATVVPTIVLPNATRYVDLLSNQTITGVKTFPAGSIAKTALAPLVIVDADVTAISENKITNLVTDLAGRAPAVVLVGASIDPTGATPCGAAMNTVLAAGAGKRVVVPPGTFLWDVAPVIPANTTVIGAGKYTSTWVKGFNGDFLAMPSGAALEHITFDGAGATRTGQGITIADNIGQQTCYSLRLKDFASTCLHFAILGGSQSRWVNLDANVYGAARGSGANYAVVIDDAPNLTAVTRSFVNYESGGAPSFDFGGSSDLYIVNSTLADLNYTTNTTSVHIANCRLFDSRASFTVFGNTNSIIGCDIYPVINLGAGANANVIGPNSYNAGGTSGMPVTDNSTSATNLVHHGQYAFTPSWSTSGTAGAIGNAVVAAYFSRAGTHIIADIEITIGVTTTFGNGFLQIGLPYTRKSGINVTGGTIVMYRGTPTNTYYVASTFIVGAVGYVRFYRDTSGGVSAASPATWAAGDTFRISVAYNI